MKPYRRTQTPCARCERIGIVQIGLHFYFARSQPHLSPFYRHCGPLHILHFRGREQVHQVFLLPGLHHIRLRPEAVRKIVFRSFHAAGERNPRVSLEHKRPVFIGTVFLARQFRHERIPETHPDPEIFLCYRSCLGRIVHQPHPDTLLLGCLYIRHRTWRQVIIALIVRHHDTAHIDRPCRDGLAYQVSAVDIQFHIKPIIFRGVHRIYAVFRKQAGLPESKIVLAYHIGRRILL